VFALAAALIGPPARRGTARRPSDRAQHRRLHLHGSARHFLGPLRLRVGQALGGKDPSGAADAGCTAIFVGRSFHAWPPASCCSFSPAAIARMYHARRGGYPHHHNPASRRRCLPALRRHPDRSYRRTARRAAIPARPCSATSPPIGLSELPLGAWLWLRRGWGAFGIWAGLSLALILIGIVLLLRLRPAATSQADAACFAKPSSGQ